MSVADSPGQRALQVVESSPIFKEPALPAPRTSSKRKKVLDEESYIEKMGTIIERDFFPDLEKLRVQNAYLDAVDTNDVVKLRELYEKYSSGAKPQCERLASPATFETPILKHASNTEGGIDDEAETPRTSSKSDSKQLRKKGDHKSLDAFLSTHTSEDNESFQEIMIESAARHKDKYTWLYQDEEEINKDIKNQLALPSIEQQAQLEDRPLNIDTWAFKNHNYIMYVPDGVELTPEERMEQAKRQQEILHSNTRFNTNPFDEHQNKEVIRGLAVVQAKTNDGKIGVDGKEVTVSTPKVNGYGFVKMNSPMPGVMDSPLMTWGEIEGTPFRLDGSDTPIRPTSGPSFKMPAPPKREKIAHALAEKAGERHRDKKQKALQTARRQLASPSPRIGSGPLERLNTMSPAAQRLASHQIRIGDSALRASYSPSPLRSPRTPSTTPGTPRTPSTPRTPGSASGTSGGGTTKISRKIPTPKINLTDNLLQLPKRPKASDFF